MGLMNTYICLVVFGIMCISRNITKLNKMHVFTNALSVCFLSGFMIEILDGDDQIEKFGYYMLYFAFQIVWMYQMISLIWYYSPSDSAMCVTLFSYFSVLVCWPCRKHKDYGPFKLCG